MPVLSVVVALFSNLFVGLFLIKMRLCPFFFGFYLPDR